MAQVNVQIRENGNYRESKCFLDDLTLRSYASKFIIINSDESASNYKVFRIRKPNIDGLHNSLDDVSFITELGDATFNHLTAVGKLTVTQTSEFKDTASGYFNINNGFKIEGISTESTVSSPNLNILTNGSNADQLHSHKSNKDIDLVVASVGGDYTDLWSAYAAANTGDVILVTNDQVTSVQRILDKQIEIIFKPSVKISCSEDIGSSVIIFGTNIITKNFTLVLSQTGTTIMGYEFDGDLSYHENIKLIMNDGGAGTGILTEAYVINSSKKGNYIKGLTQEISGTVSDIFTDNSGNTTNDAMIRGV